MEGIVLREKFSKLLYPVFFFSKLYGFNFDMENKLGSMLYFSVAKIDVSL
jgi:hypothetical protein